MNEVVDGSLQGGFDEVVLHGLLSGFSEGFMGYVVGIGIYQSPLGSDEVLVVIRVICGKESLPLLLQLSNLGRIEFRPNLEDGIHQSLYLFLGYLLLSHLEGLLLEL